MVAACCRHDCDGNARHRIQSFHRRFARCARSEAQMTALANDDVLVGIRNLRVDFRVDKTEIFEAVKGISFDIPVNSTVALVGESGSGKSVTALAILALLPKENSMVHPGGQVLYGGRNLLALPPRELQKLRGADISMVFQEPMSSLNPVFT